MSALGGSTGVIIGRGAVDLGLLNTYVCTYCLVAQFQLVLSLRATIAILYGIVLKGEKKCGYFTKPSISYSSWCTPSLFLFIICIFSRGIQRLALSRSIPIIYICCTKYCWYSTYLFPKSLSFPLREPMMTELMWEKRKDGRDPIVTRDGWWGFYCQYLALCSPFSIPLWFPCIAAPNQKIMQQPGILPKMMAKHLLWSQPCKHIWSLSTSPKDLDQGHLRRIRETHESKVKWSGAFFADVTRRVGVGVLELLELLGTLKASWSIGAFEHREVTVAVGKHDLVQQRDHKKTFQHIASSCKRHP